MFAPHMHPKKGREPGRSPLRGPACPQVLSSLARGLGIDQARVCECSGSLDSWTAAAPQQPGASLPQAGSGPWGAERGWGHFPGGFAPPWRVCRQRRVSSDRTQP